MGKKSLFSREEKIAMLQLVKEGGRTILSVANEYGVHENTLYKWQRQHEINPEEAFTEAANKHEPPSEAERLRRRVRELEHEVDFLKKVSAYFAKSPQ